MNYFELQRELLKRDLLLEMEKKFAERGMLMEPSPIVELLLHGKRCKTEQEMITKAYKEVNEDFEKYEESIERRYLKKEN